MHYYHEDLSRSKVSRHCNGDKPINFFSHLLQTADNDNDLCCCSAAVVWSLQIMLQIIFTLSLCTLQPDRVKLAQINHLPVESRQGNEAF